ncbi:lipopolysaccharide heptosyltransferase I [Conchiformibius kuhniae]|uniref:Lipopolysaccharide heptosyltransferase 1 n=1 Tax=Conchiformibius kuhniae TaxID=211502 RepID=A0A8T9MZQ7_9NEIS|nr:lipopolysaccharide heptosyltransferase I [Conchiformibius kuhniae]UOP05682.1 lipopolysaccharide heptosyltransferase I [Conchiformibius kuhniae]
MENVLLVRLSSMGDLIHTLPAVSDLARHRPDLSLHWLCEAAFADIARLHPFVAQVHEMRWRHWRKRLASPQTWREIAALKHSLRAQGFSKVAEAQGLIKSALPARWANAPVYGLDGNSAREPLASRLYQARFPVPRHRDAVWRNRCLLAQIFGYQATGAPDFGIRAAITPLPDAPAPYALALHASSRDSKLWLPQHWANLFQALHDTHGWTVLLPWGNANERARAEQMASDLPFVRVCGKMGLREAARLLAGAEAVIGVDTGLLHLANALAVPTVGIFTDSDPAKTGVQTAPDAVNLGGVGQMPDARSVFTALQTCLAHHPHRSKEHR